MEKSSKILLLDIETSPILGYTWETHEANVVRVVRDWHILSIAYKWLGRKCLVLSLPDYALYKKDPYNDRELMRDIAALLNEADIVIAQNGDRFDVRKINARLIYHQIRIPSPYQTIDTLKIARQRFAFTSNRLDALGEFLGVGRKVKTGGFDLWAECLFGNMKAWRKMCRYNIQDVNLLEKVYLKLRPWAKTHPDIAPPVNPFDGRKCLRCGSNRLQSRGQMISGGRIYRRFQCKNCGGWMKKLKKLTSA